MLVKIINEAEIGIKYISFLSEHNESIPRIKRKTKPREASSDNAKRVTYNVK